MATPAPSETPRGNVILSAAYLMPVSGKAITAHSTRERVLALLEETRARRGDGERAMIVDVSATAWNWDTYAIVAGKPSPVAGGPNIDFTSTQNWSTFVAGNPGEWAYGVRRHRTGLFRLRALDPRSI